MGCNRSERGTAETLSEGKWVRLGPGSVILNGPEAWHGLRNVGMDQGAILCGELAHTGDGYDRRQQPAGDYDRAPLSCG